jgi:hypothetical protein
MDVGIFNHLLYVCGIRDPAYRRAPNGPEYQHDTATLLR